jgi:hypothetical protein
MDLVLTHHAHLYATQSSVINSSPVTAIHTCPLIISCFNISCLNISCLDILCLNISFFSCQANTNTPRHVLAPNKVAGLISLEREASASRRVDQVLTHTHIHTDSYCMHMSTHSFMRTQSHAHLPLVMSRLYLMAALLCFLCLVQSDPCLQEVRARIVV